ncbi:ABC transporter ATP-binding protein [Paenibacillus radicis (ex Xue et al. 2023)]|uniref:ABC transporter ATP-binding protein n=1 Tax=Paenibacillus radicis (ex Xue et al. 2023) TaxID=2972489 RepID=A0ABT1YV78_9BACL|nr:ABC transporter ATP-binding protein [Paenibacillus radicis (ex Xue et al. 2023)]MCR8636855.1 ABC transporter ATP-binding protein [Paenibacillus radicis (ex Xue et al. 2023)]
MNTNAVVQLRNVTKRIGSKTIVDNLSFDVLPGEVFGFLGPNGAGKTTTIRMMVGLMSLTQGEVLVNGLSVKRQFEQAMVHVGAIVENPEFYKFLSGYQNLQHFARMIPGITEERLQEVIALVRLEHRIHDKVKTYSLGMRQRLGVAQAILHRPDVLILDEPTNGLDPEGIRELRDYLRQLSREEGLAVIVSSHLLSEMELMCDRVAIIQNGKLLDVRSFKNLENESKLLEVQFDVDNGEEAVRIATGFAGKQAVSWSPSSQAPAIKGTKPSGSSGETAPAVAVIAENEIGILTVRLNGGRDDIAELNKRLVSAAVRVYGIHTHSKSLEDQFLEVTRGNQIV